MSKLFQNPATFLDCADMGLTMPEEGCVATAIKVTPTGLEPVLPA